MNAIVPKTRVPHVSACLAWDGHDLMTAPASLVAYALKQKREAEAISQMWLTAPEQPYSDERELFL